MFPVRVFLKRRQKLNLLQFFVNSTQDSLGYFKIYNNENVFIGDVNWKYTDTIILFWRLAIS
jgi:hypothetical protein